MDFGSVFDRVLPTAMAFVTGGPAAAMATATQVEGAKKAEKRYGAQQLEYERSQMESIENIMGNQRTALGGPLQPEPSFFSTLGQNIGNFGRGVGQFMQDVSPLTSLFGSGGGASQGAQGPARTVIKQAPDESSSSGEFTGANLGMGSNIIQLASRFARSPAGQGLIGGGVGGAAALMSSGGNGMPRITRRMKADVRRIYMMAGQNPDLAAQILNKMGTYPRMNFDASLVFLILTKRFRNDGPVVTKAAVRKTKTTLRRMKGVVDMYNSVCKPTTRRAPARRAMPKAVQLIKN